MRRFLVLVIALLLPLQFAWGVAAAYCAHEGQHQGTVRQGAAHFGHHEHEHKGELKETAGGKLVIDNDCGVCHGSGTGAPSVAAQPMAPVPMAQMSSGVLSLGHPSAPGGPPDRPQWGRLA